MKKGITLRKQIHYFLLSLVILVLTTMFINYFKRPDQLYNIEQYWPSLLGAIIGWGVMFYIQYKKNPGGLDIKITDERDELIANQYNSIMLPILLFYVPIAFILYAIAMKIEKFSVMSCSIVLCLVFFVYGIGFLLYKNTKS